MQPLRVLFVCTGNTCRSAVAEGILKKLLSDSGITGVEVASCGTAAAAGFAVPPMSMQMARRMGVDLSDHRSLPISKGLVERSDIVLGMEESHVERAVELAPEARARTFLLSEFAGESSLSRREIPDPAGAKEAAYAECFRRIEKLIGRSLGLLEKMAREKGGKETGDHGKGK